ncbi:MAG: translocation/assembly module TamB domain-containing protein [Planctomycetota bacterium]|jgi:hypothetical protein
MDIPNRLNASKCVKGKVARKTLRLLTAGLTLAVLLMFGFGVLVRSLPGIAIGRIVELTNGKVETQSVDVGLDGSVFIEKLVIRPREEWGADGPILEAETVYARFDITSLLLLRPRLNEINVDGFVFNALYDSDTDRWNIAALKIKPNNGGFCKIPTVQLERGTLQYSKITDGKLRAVSAVPLKAGLGPARETPGACSFRIETGKMAGGLGKSSLTGKWRPGSITVAGGISSTDLPTLERVCTVKLLAAALDYEPTGDYSLKLRVGDFFSKRMPASDHRGSEGMDFLEKLGAFTSLQKFVTRYDPSGLIDINFIASGNLKQLKQSRFRGTVHCKDVFMCDRKFPYALKQVVGEIGFSDKGTELKNLSGRHGNVKMSFNGWTADVGSHWEYDINVTSDNMVLNRDLYTALSPEQQKFWDLFSPTGVVGIDYRFRRAPETDNEKTLTVELLGTQAAYRDFTYPLKNLAGRLFFNADSIIFSEVVSRYDGRDITLNGKVNPRNDDQPVCDLQIEANDIPLDATLAGCLSDKQRYLYDRLYLSGRTDARIAVSTPNNRPGPPDVTTNIRLKKASLKLDNLPPALSEVCGNAVVTDDLVQVQKVTGSCGSGTVALTGEICLGANPEELKYDLLLDGEKIELDNDLFRLIPESLQQVVARLKPRGQINCSVNLNKAAGPVEPCYQMSVDCLGNSINFEPFPGLLNNVTGHLEIDAERGSGKAPAGAPDVRTTPDAGAVTISGRLVQTDKDAAGGRLDLDLERIKIFGAENERFVDFCGTATFENSRLDSVADITRLNAVASMEGLYKSGEGFQKGQANMRGANLRVKGVSVKGLNMDVSYDLSQRSWFSSRFLADCYGGRLSGKFQLKQPVETPSEYLLEACFEEVDVKAFLRDRDKCSHGGPPVNFTVVSEGKPQKNSNHEQTTGKVAGWLSVLGRPGPASGNEGASSGRCRLTITDMQVGRLSPMAKLLHVLQLTEPHDFAFERMVVDSYIKQDKLYLEHLDLSGRSVAFTGSGWMNLRTHSIDLILYGRGDRLASTEPSVLQSLSEGVGQAFVQMEVTGNYCDPKIITRTLPVIGDTLGIFGARRATPKP